MARNIDVRVQFRWDGTNWTDETTNFIQASGALELVPPNEILVGGRHVIQQASITMANPNLRYSPYNTSSPLYPYIRDAGGYFTQVRIQVSVNGGSWDNVFVGYVKLPQENFAQNQITFQVYDLSEVIRQKISSGVYRDILEHELVVNYLELADLIDGIHFVSPGNPSATIDYSTRVVPFSWLDDEPIWDELVDLAQAHGSRIYIGRDGMVHYEADWHWAKEYGYTPEDFSSSNIGDFSPTYDDKAFFDEIVVEYADRKIGSAGAELWSLPRSKLIRPGEQERIVARFRWPAVNTTLPQPNDHYYLQQFDGTDVSGTYPPTITIYAQQAEIVINNGGTQPIVLNKMKVVGQPLLGQPAEQYTQETQNAEYGRRVTIRGNPYIQTLSQAQTLASYLAWWYNNAKIVFSLKNLPGWPSREVGRRVRMTVNLDDSNTYVVTGVIIRVDWQINIMGNRAIRYVQNIRAVEDVFVGNYFVVGESAIGSGRGTWH